MLGSAVYGVLRDHHRLVLTVRKQEEINVLDKVFGGVGEHQVEEFECSHVYQDYLSKKGGPGQYLGSFLERVGEVDWVINAVGITIPFSLDNPLMTLFINGAFPHILSSVFGTKLLHVTTDCVYDGKEGFPYDENSPKKPVDLYGLSKYLGEPADCLTLRTSIIGRELKGFTGLLEWFRKQDGKKVNGFSEHYWNGLTTKEFGRVCQKIMAAPDRFYKKGVYHIFSDTVNKYDLLLKLKEKYNLNCQITKDPSTNLNRTLSSVYPLCSELEIPCLEEMLKEL